MTRSGTQRKTARRRWLLTLLAGLVALTNPLALRAVPVVHPAATDLAIVIAQDPQRSDGAHNEALRALVQQYAIAPHGESLRTRGAIAGAASSTPPHGLVGLAAFRTRLALVARVAAGTWRSPAPLIVSSSGARAPPAAQLTA